MEPPGAIYIGDGLYMDETEVSNLSVLEWYYYIKRDSSSQYYNAMLPDTTLPWDISKSDIVIDQAGTDIDSTGFAYDMIVVKQNYRRYPSFRYFPAVGFSFYQASEYCKWRSGIVTDGVNDYLGQNNKKYRLKYTYYLPSIEDWSKAVDPTIPRQNIRGSLLRKIKSLHKGYNKKTEYSAASIYQDLPFLYNSGRILIKGFNFIGYIYPDYHNSKGLYNTLGNVSEMTNTEGVSFGGAWIHTESQILNQKTFNYDRPQSWLGFRCACRIEVVEL